VNASETMRINNMLGQEVRVLDEGSKNAGNYEITWDGRNSNGLPVASGIYFYQLVAKPENGREYSATRKMMILK
ncbi:MAG: FlgD immunoglobulin-like domain containing protein, partial [Calditrichia bacterium]